MVYIRSPLYLYRRNDIYYLSRNVPSDLKTQFNKSLVVVSLQALSLAKAKKSGTALCHHLDRYFEALRLVRFQSQELGLKFYAGMDTHLMRRVQVLVRDWDYESG